MIHVHNELFGSTDIYQSVSMQCLLYGCSYDVLKMEALSWTENSFAKEVEFIWCIFKLRWNRFIIWDMLGSDSMMKNISSGV